MISVYADGSSSGRSNQPGGYGWVILVDGRPFKCGYGGHPCTTNNLMELAGAFVGLLECKKFKLTGPIELVCDSQYVLGMASGRMSPNTNRTLVGKLRALSLELNVGTRWVRGHSKETWNEHCDKLAKRGKLEAQQALK